MLEGTTHQGRDLWGGVNLNGELKCPPCRETGEETPGNRSKDMAPGHKVSDGLVFTEQNWVTETHTRWARAQRPCWLWQEVMDCILNSTRITDSFYEVEWHTLIDIKNITQALPGEWTVEGQKWRLREWQDQDCTFLLTSSLWLFQPSRQSMKDDELGDRSSQIWGTFWKWNLCGLVIDQTLKMK